MPPKTRTPPCTAAWLVSNLVTNQIEEVLDTELASSRLLAGVALRAFQQAGVELLPLNLKGCNRTPDVAFVSKFVPDSGSGRYYQDGGVRHAAWVETLRRIKAAGGWVVVDYTDHHPGTDRGADHAAKGTPGRRGAGGDVVRP